MQETRIQFLVQEDPTYCKATKPVHHNYCTCALEPRSGNSWSPHALEPMLHNKRSHWDEKPSTTTREWPLLTMAREKPTQQWRPSTATMITKEFSEWLKKVFTMKEAIHHQNSSILLVKSNAIDSKWLAWLFTLFFILNLVKNMSSSY